MSQHKAYIFSINKLDSASEKWDYGLLKETFEKNNIEELVVDYIPKEERAFVVIPGQGNAGKEKEISKQLSRIKRVVLFITGDESGYFDARKISHPNISIWTQYPHEKDKDFNKFFIGVPKHLKSNLPEYPTKSYDLYFGGQITHQRRQELASAIHSIDNILYKPTSGFAQGDQPKDYYKYLASAKIAPAPAGAIVIDTFRFFEAIEMLCLPVGDQKNSKGEIDNYMKNIYPNNIPIPMIENWHTLKNIMPKLLENYPNNMHQAVCWWIKYKRDFSLKIMRHLYEQE